MAAPEIPTLRAISKMGVRASVVKAQSIFWSIPPMVMGLVLDFVYTGFHFKTYMQ